MNKLTYFLFLALSASLCFSSCSKDDQDTPPDEEEEEEEEMNGDTLSLISPCSYELFFGDLTFANDDEYMYCATTSNATTDNIGNIVIPGASIEDDGNNFNIYLSRGLLRVANFNDVPTNADFEALFQLGQYDFTRRETEGIQLEMGMPGDGLWSTDNGNNGFDQTGSSFTITEMVSGTGLDGYGYYTSIRAEYNCKLYNLAGEMKTSSGKLTVQFQNF